MVPLVLGGLVRPRHTSKVMRCREAFQSRVLRCHRPRARIVSVPSNRTPSVVLPSRIRIDALPHPPLAKQSTRQTIEGSVRRALSTLSF